MKPCCVLLFSIGYFHSHDSLGIHPDYCVSVVGSFFFFLIPEQSSVVRWTLYFAQHSPVIGHPDCFQVGAIVNIALPHICIQVFVQT